MFKNPVRHFLNINNFVFPEELTAKDLNWSKPINFTIRKSYDTDDFRVLKLPNLLNFHNLFLHLKKDARFNEINSLSRYSRMDVNLKSGDFKLFNYKENLERDLFKLTEYDILLKLDIKSFYDSIYTHKLQELINSGFTDVLLTNNNLGITKGILMGSYVSLFLAEVMLSKIADNVVEKLNDRSVDFKLKYFSDDFYFFCYKKDEDAVIYEFTIALHEFELTNNTDKKEIYNYIEYNNKNVIDKYWNKIITTHNDHVERTYYKSQELLSSKSIDEPLKYRLNFLNQLIYRKGKLKDKRLQSILINSFFKSNFFIDLNVDKYEFTQTDLHNILYLIKEHPEIMLYVIPKFLKFDYFIKSSKSFFKNSFVKSLEGPFNEEQLYYFYALFKIDINGAKDNAIIEKVLNSKNQLLISYYITFRLIDERLDSLLIEDESNWFLNYHIILRKYNINNYDILEDIKKFLIPIRAVSSERQKSNYLSFYKNNITTNKPMINLSVTKSIDSYLKEKKSERKLYNKRNF